MTLIFLFILGLAVGSFLNVLIDRLPKEQSILGRSRCDHCKKKLQATDLIPVLSFVLLGGKCRYCHKKLSWYYPLIELATGITFVLVWLFIPTTVILGSGATPESTIRFWTSQNDALMRVLYLGLFSVLIAIFFADLKYQIIPDELQIAFFVFALFLRIFGGVTLPLFLRTLLNGLIVAAPLYALYALTKGKGMGFADVKFSFSIGFLVGIANGFLAIYFGFVLGAIVGIGLLLSGRKKWKSKIAFGPFLVLGLVIVLVFQPQLEVIIRSIFGT